MTAIPGDGRIGGYEASYGAAGGEWLGIAGVLRGPQGALVDAAVTSAIERALPHFDVSGSAEMAPVWLLTPRGKSEPTMSVEIADDVLRLNELGPRGAKTIGFVELVPLESLATEHICAFAMDVQAAVVELGGADRRSDAAYREGLDVAELLRDGSLPALDGAIVGAIQRALPGFDVEGSEEAAPAWILTPKAGGTEMSVEIADGKLYLNKLGASGKRVSMEAPVLAGASGQSLADFAAAIEKGVRDLAKQMAPARRPGFN